MKPFLILQLRPETKASDSEFAAFLEKGNLSPDQTRRIRLDRNPDLSAIDLDDYSGVIVGGGPGCVSDPPHLKPENEKAIEDAVMGLMPAITTRDFPFLGCCYGIGILAYFLDGKVSKENFSEPVGAVTCSRTPEGKNDPLLKGLPDSFRAFVGHKEAVQALPPDTVHLVASAPCPFQMIRHKSNVYATQFHPEADPDGFELRIRIYKDRGYFPPEDALRLIEQVRSENVCHPETLLKNFITRYRSDRAT